MLPQQFAYLLDRLKKLDFVGERDGTRTHDLLIKSLWPQFVLGIEADFNGSSLKQSQSNFRPADTFVARNETNTEDLTWFSTVRGRLGYAMDRWLVYATGGLAVAHFNSSFNWVQVPTGTAYAGSDSTTRTGWTVGGGVEYAFAQNWSAKLEYLYLDFGTYTVNSPLQTAVAPVFWSSDVHARDNVVRVGLNYKFH